MTAKPQPGNPRPRFFVFRSRKRSSIDLASTTTARRSLRRGCSGCAIPDVGREFPSASTSENRKRRRWKLRLKIISSRFENLFHLPTTSRSTSARPTRRGLRALQEKEALSHLLSAIGEQNAGKKPVLLKIAPDLSEPELRDVIEVCETNAVAGLIATNTTIDHTAIPKEQDEEGGLSGKPLREKSTAMIRAIRAQTRLPIIASGGILDADSAREKIACRRAASPSLHRLHLSRTRSRARDCRTARKLNAQRTGTVRILGERR